MPKLDGVSATSLIRQFDHMTPIISMTSNSKPQEIMTYYSHGMNDILPKPFTKEGLLSMLEVSVFNIYIFPDLPLMYFCISIETSHTSEDDPAAFEASAVSGDPTSVRQPIRPGADGVGGKSAPATGRR